MASFDNYSSVIFWNFKRMDNVNYNFRIIEELVNSAIDSEDKEYYYKPIYMLVAAIIECTLYDFLKKINEHRYEQVPNLTKNEVIAIQDMKKVPNKLHCFKNICKKHSFLGEDEGIYNQLNAVAEIRNRIHIQNEKGHLPKDESGLWETNMVKKCGQLMKDIITIMCEKYPRPDRFHDNPTLNEFPEPWKRL